MKQLRWIALLPFFLIGTQVFGQQIQLVKQVEFSGIRGIQLSKTFPILKSGAQLNFSVSKSISPYVEAGMGSGRMILENETFTPFFLHLKASRKAHENSLFFTADIGHSQANSSDFDNNTNTIFKGGSYFSPSVGYQFVINDRWLFYISSAYTMQKAQLSHLNSQQLIYHTEHLSFDLLSFKLGFLLA